MNREKYICVGKIPNVELNKLYNGAYALLYLSSYEGFGIPILEAQKAGCPVIAYNKSSIKEVIGDTMLLLDDLSIMNIAKCLNLLSDTFIRKQVIEKGFINAQRFSWEKHIKKQWIYINMLGIIKKYNEEIDFSYCHF